MGKLLVSIDNAQKGATGYTRLIGSDSANESDLHHLKIRAIHVEGDGFEVGILRSWKPDQIEQEYAICLSVGEPLKYHIGILQCVTHQQPLTLSTMKLPEGRSLKDLSYEVEVNTATKTVRFCIDGRQIHDSDIPIKEHLLSEMCFYVMIFNRGDCLRIVD